MADQPKNFGFGVDEAMLRDAARRFFEDHYSADKLHGMVAHDSNVARPNECVWNRDHWRQVTALGWPACCVPERAGGIGMPAVAGVALAEEAGRAGFPSPLLSTLNATFVLSHCSTDAADAALADIPAGTTVSLAMTDRRGSADPADTDVSVIDGKLTGTAAFVQDARKADRFVVSASDGAKWGFTWSRLVRTASRSRRTPSST